MEQELNDLLRQVELIKQRAIDTYSAWHKAKVEIINADSEYRKLREESAVIENRIKELGKMQDEIQQKMRARQKMITNTSDLTALYVARKEAEAAKDSMERRLYHAFNPGYRNDTGIREEE